jgi:hypothetical protein
VNTYVQVYDTQRQLERESQLLKAELAALQQQLSSWSNTTQQLLEGLKHAGDLEHYVAVLSREAAAVAKVLTAAAAAEAQAEAVTAESTAEEVGAAFATGSSELGAAAGGGQDQTAGAAAAAQVPAAAGSGQQVAAVQSSTPEQPEAPLELPVSKRASR